MRGSRMQCGAGKPIGGQRLLAISTVASGRSFSRAPSRRWIGLRDEGRMNCEEDRSGGAFGPRRSLIEIW